MKINKTLPALVAGASLGLSGQATAGGTTAGTDIVNTVSLGYTVNSTAQTPVTSTEQFKVDTKIDMTITSNTANADTAPGETIDLAYTLVNTGNEVQSFVLSLGNNGDANHSPQSVSFHTASPTLPGNLITNSKITDLAVDGAGVTVYAQVVMTNNVNVTNGDTVEMNVSATALDSADTDGTTLLAQNIAADKNANLTTEYVVFAEAATGTNLKHTGVITVQTDRDIVTAEFTNPLDPLAVPTLAIEIINDVICDSALASASTTNYATGGANVGTCPDIIAGNKTTYRPKAIPTSMALFTYDAKNTGSKTANAVTFSETLEAGYTDASIANATLSINGATNETLVPVAVAPTADNEIFIDTATGSITLYIGDVTATSTIKVTFTAIVE